MVYLLLCASFCDVTHSIIILSEDFEMEKDYYFYFFFNLLYFYLYRRISALSVKVLLELCKDECGDLALGKMLSEDHEPQPLGGLSFILSCVLRIAAEYTTWPWWLGRLLFLRKLMDEYVSEFQLSDDSPSDQMESAGVLVHDRIPNAKSDMGEIYQDNLTRLLSVLKFTMQTVNCSHSKVSKLAIAVLMCCSSLASHDASASRYISKVVSKLKPAQRSALQRQILSIPGANSAPVSLSYQERQSVESQLSRDAPSSISSNRDSAIGSLSAASDDETDYMSESELLQTLERPQSLLLSPCFSPSKELNLDWSRSIEDSPRMPPARLVLGKKCQEIIEQEEAEAVAKALAVSHQPAPSKIQSLDTGDEMVIVFTQPEVGDGKLHSFSISNYD